MSQWISILQQNTESFERPESKNCHIGNTKSEWLGFADSDVTDEEEIDRILAENRFLHDYDVIIFGENLPEGECGFTDILLCPQMVLYAFCFRRDLLVKTGCINQLLAGNCNFEFLLRLARKGRVYSIPCASEGNLPAAVLDSMTMAYVVRTYLSDLKNAGILDDVFLFFTQIMEQCGKKEEFAENMDFMLEDSGGNFEKIAIDTAPYLIFVGDETCYGVPNSFSGFLADELAGLGQAVITTDGKYGDYYDISSGELKNRIYKAVIGFQAPALESDFFRKIKGKRIQFWFDNPIFFNDFFSKVSEKTYILCQDAYYAEFIKAHYHIENVMQLPPAGSCTGIPASTEGRGSTEKKYDIVFIGSYDPMPSAEYDDAFKTEFYQYCVTNADSTFDQALYVLLQKNNAECDEISFLHKLNELREVCYDVLFTYRHRIIEAIADAGIQLHVFGETWKKYNGKGKANLILHSQVTVEESLQIWSQSKIGLNIMTGHKAGMTERIANIMLCGACCLSDETVYLKNNFDDDREIVLYRGDALEKLPEKIQYLLEHDAEREAVALAGQKKALSEHTWRKRAEELLNLS